jgi:hypothetical protein
MSTLKDPFELVVEEIADDFERLTRTVTAHPSLTSLSSATIARFHGFDLDDTPLVVELPGISHELIRARTTVSLQRTDIGSPVVLLFEDGDVRRPIVVGVVQGGARRSSEQINSEPLVSVQADDERFVVSAEQEIVLRCGDASITLTRAGKVIIKGTYVLSRSSGYNKIKGAAVDIN